MLTFYDEKGNGYGAQVEFTTKNAVNGERSVSGTILSNDKVLSKIDRGWSFDWDGETYKIIFAKPKDEGRSLSVSFDAVHQFFYDFDHSNCYQVFNGSNRLEVYIEAMFKNSGYRYVIEAQANAIRKENFGNASRLKMFKDIIKAAGLEFSVTGKVVRIVKKVGTDLSTVVRKNFNMNELTLEKNIGGFITYKKGFGAWKDENNHDAGRYETEYESPLARIYGRIEGEPIRDDRYKETGKLLERLKHDVDSSYSISVQLEMEDLTRAGYKYTQPRAGDYIMAINEMIEFREKIRIVSYESSYDVTGRLLSHKVTCNDIGTVQKAISSEGSIMRSVGQSKEFAESALAIATKALVSADGKNTIYYGAEKPRDQPRGTLHRGDLLYLTVGEETELYFWNGSEWELKHLKFDSSKLEKMFADSKATTDKAIAEANKRAEEALKKAGTLPDTTKLSDQIKQQILSGQDLTRKVTETLNQTDGGVIYNKIYQNIQNNFASKEVGDYLMDEHDRMLDTQSRLDSEFDRQKIEFQKLIETNKLYERIIGTSETDAPDKLSRLVMSSDIFQTEVGKYVTDDNNLIVNSETMDQHVLVNNTRSGVNVSVSDGIFTIKAQGLTSYNWSGFTLPIYVRKIYKGETYSLGFKYRIRGTLDQDFNVIIKNHVLNRAAFVATVARSNTPVSDEWKEFQGTFYMPSDFEFGNNRNLPFYVYVTKNGWVEIKEIMLVRGSRTGPYKPSQFDDAFAETKALGSQMTSKIGEVSDKADGAKQLAINAQAKAVEVAEQARQAQQATEAVRTQVTQLAGSWSVRNINSAGDIVNSINLLPDGSTRFDGKLLRITGKTVIDEAVIDSANLKKVSASKISGGIADFNKMTVINFDAGNITTGVLKGINVKGSIFSSLDDSFYIDTKKNEFYLNDQTLFTFYNRDQRMYSFLGTGNRLGNGEGGGLMIGVDCDDREMYKMHGPGNGRDLWTASSYTSTTLELSANKTKKTGTIMAKAPTGIKLSVKPSGVAYSDTYIEIGDTISNSFKNKIIATADDISLSARNEITLRSSKKVTIAGGAGSSLRTESIIINQKDLVAYFNALADFVVRIAEHAGWTVKSTYRI